MADPVTLATVTSAVAALGLDIAKQAASDATKALWAKVKSALGWAADPPADKLAVEAAKTLVERPDLVAQVTLLLKSAQEEPAGRLVGTLEVQSGGKVVVAGHVENITM